MTIANKIRIYGEQVQDVTIMQKTLKSLIDRFNYVHSLFNQRIQEY